MQFSILFGRIPQTQIKEIMLSTVLPTSWLAGKKELFLVTLPATSSTSEGEIPVHLVTHMIGEMDTEIGHWGLIYLVTRRLRRDQTQLLAFKSHSTPKDFKCLQWSKWYYSRHIFNKRSNILHENHASDRKHTYPKLQHRYTHIPQSAVYTSTC